MKSICIHQKHLQVQHAEEPNALQDQEREALVGRSVPTISLAALADERLARLHDRRCQRRLLSAMSEQAATQNERTLQA